jgi:LytR cell envelope-related transcriptional attenuator
LIDRIGPYLGVAAFLALSVLAILLIIQAREIRRLREWAGRAPERAAEAAEATSAAAEAKGEPREEKAGLFSRIGGAFAAWRAGLGERLRPAYDAVDRRSPIDPRIVLGLLVAAVVAVGVVTSGFGLGGGGGSSDSTAAKEKKHNPKHLKVAVLNGSQQPGVAGVPGLADDVLRTVVEPAGYKDGVVRNAPKSYPQSVVLFASGEDRDGKALAKKAGDQLGKLKAKPMTADVTKVVDGAPLAVVIGVDNQTFDSTP